MSKKVTIQVPPDGGYAWVILIACFTISFILDGIMYSIGPIVEKIRVHYNETEDIANLIPGLNGGLIFFSGPIVSALTNQFGIRIVVIIGAILTSLTYILSAFSPSIYLVIGLFAFGGITTGCTYIASLIIVANYFDKKKGIATGITMAGSGLGGCFMALISEYLNSALSWDKILIIYGAFIFICAIMGIFLRPVPTSIPNSAESDETENLNVTGSSSNSANFRNEICEKNIVETDSLNHKIVHVFKELTDFSLLRNNFSFTLILLSNFFVFCGYFPPFLLISKRPSDPNINGIKMLSIINGMNIPFRIILGFIADRKFISAVNLYLTAALIAAISLFVYPVLNTTPLLIGFSVLYAFGAAGINCLGTSFLTEIVGNEKFNKSMGLLNLFIGFGWFLGTYVVGIIEKNTKDNKINGPLILCAATFVIGVIFALLISLKKIFTDKKRSPNEAVTTLNLL